MGRRQFAVHRWLTALVSVQLFLWSLGGLIFATHDLDWVHGDEGRDRTPASAIDFSQVRLSPSQATAEVFSQGADGARTVVLRTLLGRAVYEVRAAERVGIVDAVSGEVLTPLREHDARALAIADRLGETPVRSVDLLIADPPTEYRGGGLPAWRVVLDDVDHTHIYVDANSGRITARRNDAWRRFDFFWMLHTMDYRGRDDFNSILLTVFAALGMSAVISGWVLWGARLRRRWRRH